MKKILKVVFSLAVAYIGIVVIFESLLGFIQPKGADNLILTLKQQDGTESQRVLSLFESEGELYLAANHWPRGWFNAVKENPNVYIQFGEAHTEQSGAFTAIEISVADHRRVLADNPSSPILRFLMGYPPREFLRLERRLDPEA